MSYLVLARKYRPQKFDDLLGQESISTTLKNSIQSGHLAHAYLFFGPRGVGKTSAARILAMALNCKAGPTPQPCGKCVPCREIPLGNSLDTQEMDAATHTQVDKIREVIIETAGLAPVRDRYKMFIIDEAHMLSNQAFNALLKTMEEPPSHVVFVLATTEPAKIPPTVFSRCQRFRFKPIPAQTISQQITRVARDENLKVEPQAVEMIARAASGSMRDGLVLLDQVISFGRSTLSRNLVAELLGILPQDILEGVLLSLLGKDRKALWKWLERIFQEGHDPMQILRSLRDALESCYMDRSDLVPSKEPALARVLQSGSAQAFQYLLRRVQACIEEVKSSDSPNLTLELGLLQMLEPAHDLAAWVSRLESLEARISTRNSTSLCASERTSGAPTVPGLRPGADASGPLGSAPRAGAQNSTSPRTSGASNVPELREGAGAPGAGVPGSGPPPPGERLIKPDVGDGGANPHPSCKTENTASENLASVWAAAASRVRHEEPALGACIARAEIRQGSAPGSLKLVFGSTLFMSQAAKQQQYLEKVLGEGCGQKVNLEFETGDFKETASAPVDASGTSKSEDLSETSTSEDSVDDEEEPPREEPALPNQEQNLGTEDPLNYDPGVKKVLRIFPGKLRRGA